MDPRYARILIGIGSAVAVLLVALIVALAVSGDDGVATTAVVSGTVATTAPPPPPSTSSTTTMPSTTTTTPPTTSTSIPPTTTTPPTTSTTLPAGPCATLTSATVPASATGITSAFGDLDGDGAPDEVIVYNEGGTWWLQVRLHYGYATEVAIPGMVARAVTVADLGGPQEVAIAQVDAGASAEIMGFFAMAGCNLFSVTDDSGAVAMFPVGGTVTHLDGFTCTGDGITVTSASETSPGTWDYSAVDYVYVPGLLELRGTLGAATILTSPADDATISSAGDFDC